MAITTSPAPFQGNGAVRQLLVRLAAVLQDERLALEDGAADRVGALSLTKEKLLAELAAAVRAGTAGGDRQGVPAALEPGLAALLKQAAIANAVNSQFVATRLAYVRARFAGLMQAGYLARAAVAGGDLYKADGFTGGARHHGSYGHA